MSKLPDFIVCGFQKCGTTAAAHILDTHPEVTIARTKHNSGWGSNGKEFNFFIDPESSSGSSWKRGIKWYKSHFKQDDSKWGYCNPNYGMLWSCDWSAEKMQKNLENVKLVFTIRNPIYREYSAYNHAWQYFQSTGKKWSDWPDGKDFYGILKTDAKHFYINYIHILKTYEKLFGKDNIHVMIQECMKSSNYQAEYNKLFDYLNVKHAPVILSTQHTREYDRGLNVNEKEYLIKQYSSEVNELFDWLGYKIDTWGEFI